MFINIEIFSFFYNIITECNVDHFISVRKRLKFLKTEKNNKLVFCFAIINTINTRWKILNSNFPSSQIIFIHFYSFCVTVRVHMKMILKKREKKKSIWIWNRNENKIKIIIDDYQFWIQKHETLFV